jgi:hypothetical protein
MVRLFCKYFLYEHLQKFLFWADTRKSGAIYSISEKSCSVKS